MHRRDFLDPRQAARTAGQVLGAIDEVVSLEPAEAPTNEIALLRLGWRAMATRFEIVLPFDTPDACTAGQDVFELLDELEDQMTVYRDHSEVCQINRTAARGETRVEPHLFDLFRLSKRIWEETDGAFDITAHALIRAWGFFKGPKRVPSAEERAEALACVGMQHVVLNEERRTVRFDRARMEINLGSIGKGYALDRLAEQLRQMWKIGTGLLHGGSSSVYAMGCPPDEGRGWFVRIRHPWQQDRYLAGVWLRDRALGTSAATFQHLRFQGKKLGHILDPRTGWPASGLASVSVLAPTAALADSLSTAFYVGGLDVARRYCKAHPEVSAIVLPEGGEVQTVGQIS